MKSAKYLILLAVSPLLLITTGCSFTQVKPWDRDLLAQQDMQLIPDPIAAGLDEHIYFSKEASSGGEGVGGGGCGCN